MPAAPPPPTPQIPAAVVNLMSVFNAATSETDELSIQEKNVITYIGGYICKKLKPIVCPGCQSAISSHLDEDDPNHSFLVAKNYASAKTGLLAPSSMLGELLQDMEVEYNRVIDSYISKPGVKTCLIKSLFNLAGLDVQCGVCHLKESVTHLFVNIRLHHTIRQANKKMKNEKNPVKTEKR